MTTTIWLSSLVCYAQGTKIDSLKKLLDQKRDFVAQTEIHLTLAREYASVNFDSSRHYATLTVNMATQGELPETAVKATLILSRISTFEGDFKRSDSLLTAAYGFAEKNNLIKELGDVFLARGLWSEFKNEFDRALLYYDSAYQSFDEISYRDGIGDCYMNKAIVYYSTGNLKNALFNFDLASSVFLETGNMGSHVFVLSNSGNVYKLLGLLDKASDNYYEALAYFEEEQDKSGVANILLNLGNIEIELENYQKAKKLLLQAFVLINEIGDDRNLIPVSQNLGVVYSSENNYDSSNYYLQVAKNTSENLQSYAGLGMALESIGENYFRQDRYDRAISYFLQSLEYKVKENKPRNLILTYLNLARSYDKIDQSEKALDYFDRALAKSQETEAKDVLTKLYWQLYEYHKSKNNFSSSLKYLEAYQTTRDSLINEQKTEQILAQEIKYETDKKAKELELQKALLRSGEAELKNKSLQRNLLIIGIVVLISAFSLVFYFINQKSKTKELIYNQQKELEEMRSRFFASISHEFRTPLTLISAPVTQLINKYNDKDTKWTLNLIQQNANRLLRLINQLLDLSKLEVGKLELKVAKEDIISALRVTLASFESLAESREIQFKRNIPDIPVTTFFDREKIEQIVSNLLSNAFKFTPEGGRVEANILRKEGELLIEIVNTGTSISEEDKLKIFERFYQVDSKHQAEGTGIGLALVKELTELHHGNVRVSGEEGKTLFTIQIPTDDSAYMHDQKVEPQTLASDRVPRSSKLEGHAIDSTGVSDLPRLVLAEDNSDLRNYIKKELGDLYEVQGALNGKEAVELAITEIPDLIITDLMMPEMDGEELLEAVRSDPKTQHIPVIMLTARADQESKLNNIGKGADHYLNKPFEIEELKVRIQSLLEQRERIRNHHQTQFMTSPKVEDVSSIQDVFLRQVGKLLELHLNDSDFSVDQFAKEMSMSRVQLHRKMKAIIGYSASDFIRQYRLKKAYEYLESKKGTVSEIAYDVGFSNLSYFTKAFKEEFNIKPSELL
ncbi:MAG: tetratricopeptide repeat protein [Bacteroidota bacterium]